MDGSSPLYTQYGGKAPARTGTSHAAIVPYGTYACGDGQRYVLSIQNEREWRAFCEGVLEKPDLAHDPRFTTTSRRVANRAELDTIIDEQLSQIDGAAFATRLELARIAYARTRDVTEVISHPQLTARDRWREVGSPVGPLQAVLPPITVANREPRMDPIPAVGEHTLALLSELGYSPEEIATFGHTRLF
jgi:crotonobetainyl-CoA:carnitine CoA-transferase CaiB-like acyl-CoA transferase